MKIKEKNKWIPKLRFPEFMDSGEWEETTLNKVAVLNFPQLIRLAEAKL